MQTFTLTGDISLLCSALEFAASKYNKYAKEAAPNFPSLVDQFTRQAEQAQELLSQAYDIRDA